MKKKYNEKILKAVQSVLANKELVEEILSKYDLENETLEEYENNRKTRILEILNIAGVNAEDYEVAIRESSQHGIKVVLARDIPEIYINNYNAEWIRAWDGNLDIQIVFDFFSVITYITEYFCKDDTGTTAFLKEAAKNIKHLTQQQQRKYLKNVFLTHRQMGQFEAFMKIFPNWHMKDSNIKVEYIPLGKPHDISRYLVRANEDYVYPNKELFKVKEKMGSYYEKPNMIEKYIR